eukprot:4453783-Amphidinium_carterae.1
MVITIIETVVHSVSEISKMLPLIAIQVEPARSFLRGWYYKADLHSKQSPANCNNVAMLLLPNTTNSKAMTIDTVSTF